MKILHKLVLLTFLFIACRPDNIIPPNPNGLPTIFTEARFDVLMEKDITYAEGLSHQSVNSANATTIPLKLDAFIPDNNANNRPAIMLIHGGGFIGGTRKDANIVHLAEYFCSRGWVAFSIDYRLRDDKGTVPTEWEAAAQLIDPEDVGQFLAIYPAHRDAKAALRWIIANADSYGINTDYITVGGGSAGAITSIALGISAPEDFRDELDLTQDPTLGTTNTDQSYSIQTVLDFWGSKISLDALEMVFGHNRFDAHNPPLIIMHGTEDPTVPFSGAEALKALYDSTGVAYAYYPLQGKGHGAWNVEVDGKRLEELSFDFVIEQQDLNVE